MLSDNFLRMKQDNLALTDCACWVSAGMCCVLLRHHTVPQQPVQSPQPVPGVGPGGAPQPVPLTG